MSRTAPSRLCSGRCRDIMPRWQRVATRGGPENPPATSSLTHTQGFLMNNYCVYVHRKITDGSIFYVGKGCGEKRARSKSARSTRWKRSEAKHGRSVHIVASGLTNDAACELEIFLISEIGRESLVNMTDGGEGAPGRTVSKRTRDIVRSKNAGRPPSKSAIESALKKTRRPVVTMCGMRFSCISEAARFISPEKPHSAKINISCCCNGRRGQREAYGLEFRFEVDGKPYLGNHPAPQPGEHVIFNSEGLSFRDVSSAAKWCISHKSSNKSIGSASSNIISAINGRVGSAYGCAWWRLGEEPKEYVAPQDRRAGTMRGKK